jgi:hypothetical protein
MPEGPGRPLYTRRWVPVASPAPLEPRPVTPAPLSLQAWGPCCLRPLLPLGPLGQVARHNFLIRVTLPVTTLPDRSVLSMAGYGQGPLRAVPPPLMWLPLGPPGGRPVRSSCPLGPHSMGFCPWVPKPLLSLRSDPHSNVLSPPCRASTRSSQAGLGLSDHTPSTETPLSPSEIP